jgi:hypothetical protein
LQRDPRLLAQRPLEQEKKSQICPCRLSTAIGGSIHDVLAGGEGLVGEELVLYDLQNLLSLGVGDVLEEQRRSMADGDGWRRPWWRVSIPGEGLANRDEQGVQEHHGSVGMRFPCPIWSETGQKVVLDGGAARVLTGSDGGIAFCKLGCRRVARK